MAGNATALMRLLGKLKYLAGRSGKAARPTGVDVFQARSSPVGMVGDDVAFWDVASIQQIDAQQALFGLGADRTSQRSQMPP